MSLGNAKAEARSRPKKKKKKKKKKQQQSETSELVTHRHPSIPTSPLIKVSISRAEIPQPNESDASAWWTLTVAMVDNARVDEDGDVEKPGSRDQQVSKIKESHVGREREM